jgi:hypothetical protein
MRLMVKKMVSKVWEIIIGCFWAIVVTMLIGFAIIIELLRGKNCGKGLDGV